MPRLSTAPYPTPTHSSSTAATRRPRPTVQCLSLANVASCTLQPTTVIVIAIHAVVVVVRDASNLFVCQTQNL